MAKVTGGIYILHLKNNIVQPALEYMGLSGSRAMNQVTGTFLAEGYAGGYTYLKQLGNGPAIGPMQMELVIDNDIWKNFLLTPKRSHLGVLLKTIAGNLFFFFVAAMCRIFYLRVLTLMEQYHKKYYKLH